MAENKPAGSRVNRTSQNQEDLKPQIKDLFQTDSSFKHIEPNDSASENPTDDQNVSSQTGTDENKLNSKKLSRKRRPAKPADSPSLGQEVVPSPVDSLSPPETASSQWNSQNRHNPDAEDFKALKISDLQAEMPKNQEKTGVELEDILRDLQKSMDEAAEGDLYSARKLKKKVDLDKNLVIDLDKIGLPGKNNKKAQKSFEILPSSKQESSDTVSKREVSISSAKSVDSGLLSKSRTQPGKLDLNVLPKHRTQSDKKDHKSNSSQSQNLKEGGSSKLDILPLQVSEKHDEDLNTGKYPGETSIQRKPNRMDHDISRPDGEKTDLVRTDRLGPCSAKPDADSFAQSGNPGTPKKEQKSQSSLKAAALSGKSRSRPQYKLSRKAKKWIRLAAAAAGILAVFVFLNLIPLIPNGFPIEGTGLTSYFVMLAAAIAGMGLVIFKGFAPGLKQTWLIGIGCGLFSLMLCLANYPSWYTDPMGVPAGWTDWSIFWLWIYAGAVLGFFAFEAIAWALNFLHDHAYGRRHLSKWGVFAASFLVVGSIMLYIFYQALYPGLWLSDSISQIRQGYENVYSNHHPFAHTLIIKGLLSLGYAWFHTVNGAVAVYSVTSLVIMSLVIAYAVMSVYEITRSYWVPSVCLLIFAGSYYNWFYAVSILKDTFFAIAFLGFAAAALRILMETGNRLANNIMLGFFALCVCLFRSNGLMAMLALALICLVCLWKSRREFALILLAASIAGYIFIGPVYKMLNIEPARYAESFSIPEQQIGRVVAMDRPLSPEQQEMISALMPLDDMKRVYTYWLSDPIKGVLSSMKNEEILQENKKAYQQIWLDLFKAYPMDYLFAWVGQTMGYWNGDYNYWRVLNTKEMNELEMENIVQDEFLHKNLYDLVWWMQNVCAFPVAIGLHTWIVLGLGIYILCRRETTWPPVLLTLLTLGTLVVATPVYSEFRYAYFMFLSMPVLYACAFLDDPKPENSEE